MGEDENGEEWKEAKIDMDYQGKNITKNMEV